MQGSLRQLCDASLGEQAACVKLDRARVAQQGAVWGDGLDFAQLFQAPDGQAARLWVWVLQESLETLMQGKTVIAIAHRLSTIARMDRLVVLDGGRIVESGTHAELLEHGGLYARLWAHQTGGFVGVD